MHPQSDTIQKLSKICGQLWLTCWELCWKFFKRSQNSKNSMKFKIEVNLISGIFNHIEYKVSVWFIKNSSHLGKLLKFFFQISNSEEFDKFENWTLFTIRSFQQTRMWKFSVVTWENYSWVTKKILKKRSQNSTKLKIEPNQISGVFSYFKHRYSARYSWKIIVIWKNDQSLMEKIR